MGIEDLFGEKETSDEIEIKRTFTKDGNEMIHLGGKFRKEVINEGKRIEEENEGLLVADDGVITTPDPQDMRYPHIAGKDYQGNLVSAGNLYRCKEKGCNRMVSSLSGVEYKHSLWRCQEHYKKYWLRQIFKAIFSIFCTFKEED